LKDFVVSFEPSTSNMKIRQMNNAELIQGRRQSGERQAQARPGEARRWGKLQPSALSHSLNRGFDAGMVRLAIPFIQWMPGEDPAAPA